MSNARQQCAKSRLKDNSQMLKIKKCHLEKCHKDIYTLCMRKFPSRTTCKKSETGRGIGGAL